MTTRREFLQSLLAAPAALKAVAMNPEQTPTTNLVYPKGWGMKNGKHVYDKIGSNTRRRHLAGRTPH